MTHPSLIFILLHNLVVNLTEEREIGEGFYRLWCSLKYSHQQCDSLPTENNLAVTNTFIVMHYVKCLKVKIFNDMEIALRYISRVHFFHWSDKAIKVLKWLYSAHAPDKH